MKRLWIQLTLAFALVVAIAVLTIGVIANYRISKQFRHFVAQAPQPELVSQLTTYYNTNQTWEGVEDVFQQFYYYGHSFQPADPNDDEKMDDVVRGYPFPPSEHIEEWLEQRATESPEEMQRHSISRPPRNFFMLTDADGTLLYDGLGKPVPNGLLDSNMVDKTSIVWNDKPVGYLIVRNPRLEELTPLARVFLSEINMMLLRVGLLTIGLGIIIGLVIARGISAPLSHLEQAVRHFSQGKFDQRVQTSGTEEVASVGRAFNDMAETIQHARDVQKNMIADVAHELRTPLSVVRGNLQAILEDVYPLEKAEIATIYDETLVLNRLVNDLHQLAQAEAGQLKLNMQSTDIAALVKRSSVLFRDIAADKEVTLNIHQIDDTPLVMADPARVQQVLHNLLSNAVRHTPQGGTIDVDIVYDETSRPHPTVKVSVRDSGGGISPDHLPHVFERFWRADTSRSRDQGGTGLGLAIAKQLVEAQGGHIGVESTVGTGSLFWFMLPVPAN